MEVQGETEVMIPDTMRRLERAVDELHEFVVSARGPRVEGARRAGAHSGSPFAHAHAARMSATAPSSAPQTVHGAELEGSAQLEAARALLAEARPEGAPAGADEDERI